MGIDLGIWEKLRTLKERYTSEHPDALKQITEWESTLRRLADTEGFVNLDTTRTIVENLKQRLKQRLLERVRDGMTPENKAVEDELRYVLGLLNPRFEQEIESISQLIDNEL